MNVVRLLMWVEGAGFGALSSSLLGLGFLRLNLNSCRLLYQFYVPKAPLLSTVDICNHTFFYDDCRDVTISRKERSCRTKYSTTKDNRYPPSVFWFSTVLSSLLLMPFDVHFGPPQIYS
jgi:hypothetical protein